MQTQDSRPLVVTSVQCCVCETDNADLIGKGEDFEYRTSSDTFSAMRCRSCGLVYLNPRPSVSEFERIYPPTYHAFSFSEANFGLVHSVRSRLEARRLLSWCHGLRHDARLLDVGCGDGFHLGLLREFGKETWTLSGIDIDKRAVEMARKAGLRVHLGSIEEIDLPREEFDMAFMLMTIEHVEKPVEALERVRQLLRPGGRLVIVTDNTGTLDFKLFKGSYWGGYHFPRHWNLFNRNALKELAEKAEFEVEDLATQVSPVNWVYSIHNALIDHAKSQWLAKRFTLKSTVTLSAFTVLDMVLQKFGKGALLRAILRKPLEIDR
ncbi:MAG TPA: class I SAM-dependent methyltransferase [Gemmatimonadaceae bacterium]|jgi:SAM-dependent methyltransferase|nr:class I SAM-dependent methyltransferase [Gemmatimonadaceae bacterium]